MLGGEESDGLGEKTVQHPGGPAVDAPVSPPRLHGRKQATGRMGGVADDGGPTDAALMVHVRHGWQRDTNDPLCSLGKLNRRQLDL